MRFIGIDIASEVHTLAVVDERGEVVHKPTAVREDDEGYHKVFELLGEPAGCLVALEATGHYWQNLVAALLARGFEVALLNPLRTRRFAQEDLERTKTDALDALSIARFAAQKRPAGTRLPDAATEELRELVRFRGRLQQEMGDKTRLLHRVVDLGFPEFTRYVHKLDSELATAILHEYPTARAFQGVTLRRLSGLRYDGRHRVGDELAATLLEAAKVSVGAHHGDAYRLQARCLCEDLDLLRRRLRQVEADISGKLAQHEVGSLLTSIDGIGPTTAACIIAEVGDPARFRDADALACYVGVVPALRQSGKRQPTRGAISRMGNARLRHALWMPTLSAVQRNPWLREHYQRLRARGKLPKVALVACMRKLLTAVYSVAKHRRPFEAQVASS